MTTGGLKFTSELVGRPVRTARSPAVTYFLAPLPRRQAGVRMGIWRCGKERPSAVQWPRFGIGRRYVRGVSDGDTCTRATRTVP